MPLDRYRLPIALAAVLCWILITLGWGFWRPHDGQGLVETVSGGISWNIFAAGLFLLVVTLVCRWRDIGFGPAQPARSLLLLWFPSLYIVAFIAINSAIGWPQPQTLAFLAINTLLVGFSEELAFRGVLLRALLRRLPVWPAIWISTAAFGGVHVLNVLVTGNLAMAATQAVAAGMSGLLFTAIVLRTGSIVPAMIFHAIWDFVTLSLVANMSDVSAVNPPPLALLVPVLFVLPNFLYGLFLLRKVGRREQWQGAALPA